MKSKKSPKKSAESARGTPEPSLKIRRVALSDLIPDPANARVHDEQNIGAIVASLQRFGQAEPLVVQKSSMRLIAGHGRLQAMKLLSWVEADVVELDVDDLTAASLGIAMNRAGELAAWDEKALGRLIESLRSQQATDGIGFDAEEMDRLIEVSNKPSGKVDDPGIQEAPENVTTQPGDLWTLGQHRLLCGDSTNPEDVDRLMNGEKAKLCSTDPPYLIDYTGERPGGGKNWTGVYREIDIKDPPTFFRGVFLNVMRVIAPNTAIYCWYAHKRFPILQAVWAELGILDHQQIIWVKPIAVFGRVFYAFQHEPCVYAIVRGQVPEDFPDDHPSAYLWPDRHAVAMMGWRQGSKPPHDGNVTEFTSVWQVDWEGKARPSGAEHPTEKPVEIFARPMRRHTRPGDVVYEPFSGSGSQLIAAEREGRRCRAMEVSPVFCDVAIRRWELATGQEAMHPCGKTYKQLTEERCSPQNKKPTSSKPSGSGSATKRPAPTRKSNHGSSPKRKGKT